MGLSSRTGAIFCHQFIVLASETVVHLVHLDQSLQIISAPVGLNRTRTESLPCEKPQVMSETEKETIETKEKVKRKLPGGEPSM